MSISTCKGAKVIHLAVVGLLESEKKRKTYTKKNFRELFEIQFNVLYFIWQLEQWGLGHCRWRPGPTLEGMDVSCFSCQAWLPVLLPSLGEADSRVVMSEGFLVSLTQPLPLV